MHCRHADPSPLVVVMTRRLRLGIESATTEEPHTRRFDLDGRTKVRDRIFRFERSLRVDGARSGKEGAAGRGGEERLGTDNLILSCAHVVTLMHIRCA